MKGLNIDIDISVILIIILIFITFGEPDILDGLIKRANDCNIEIKNENTN